MTYQFRLRIEQRKAMTALQERDLLQAAVARNPSPFLKRRLATMFMISDRYDEAIPLWEDCIAVEPDWSAFQSLANSLLARENEQDTLRARTAAQQATEHALQGARRAAALATLGKAHARLGDDAAAKSVLEEALAENPHDKDAFKRLVALYFRRNEPRSALALYERLLSQGVRHSRLFVARTAALARLGCVEEARAFENLAQFSPRRMLQPPAGWSSLEAFNAALAEELANHPTLRYERYGTASTKTWRIDEPATGGSELLAALYAQMRRFICEFVDEIADVDHPWVRARPQEAMLHNWCVITDGPGFEEWHVHQFGWLTGVYYVAVPEAIACGNGVSGCIGFGLPEDLVGEQMSKAYGLDLIRPQAGLAMLFPSHAYHRTFRHQVRERRICLAFDVRPM
jgi:tetratricopeptide (TPR) repeat protein